MEIGEIFIDLHGNQYKVLDCHVIGPEYPLFTDNRDAILTNSIQGDKNMIIRGNDQLIMYNSHYRVYWLYEIQFIEHHTKFDIRRGYNAKNTKSNRTHRDADRLSQSRSRSKRS